MLTRVKTRTGMLTLVLIVGLLGALLWNGITLLAAVVLVSVIGVLGLGIFARLVIGFLACGAFGAMAMEVTTLARIEMNFTLVYVLLLAMAFLYAWVLRDRITLRTSLIDVAALVVGAVVFVVVAMPLFGAGSSKVMEALLPGEDNSSHLQMYRYVLTENQYAFENKPEEAGIRPSLLSYAQGSHALMATLTAPVAESASREVQLKIYAYMSAVTYAVVFWLAFLVIILPFAAIKDRRVRVTMAGMTAFPYLFILPFGTLLGLYTYGYYPQNLSYVGLVLLILVLASLMERKAEAKGTADILLETGMLLLGLYLVFASWYLLTFVALPIVLGYVWVRRRTLWRARIPILLLVTPIAVLAAYLAYVYLFRSSGANHVLTPGGVVKMQVRLLVVALPALVLAAIALRRRQGYFLGFTLSVLAAAAMSSLIGAYQYKKIDHLDYYFYKSLFTVALVAAVYYGYVFSRAMASMLASLSPATLRARPLTLPAMGLVLVAVCLFSFSMPKHLGNYVETRYSIPETSSNRILDPLIDPSIYSAYSDAIFLNNCNPYTNFTATIWSGSLFLPYTPLRHQIENDLATFVPQNVSQPNNKLINAVAEYASSKDKPVAIVVGGECTSTEAVGSAVKDRNVRIIESSALLAQ
jgi:hypothetical protein